MNPLFASAAEGREAIRQAVEHDFQTLDPKNLVIKTSYVQTSGDVGFSYGTYTMNLRTPDGERLEDRGKWVTGCRRENGRWRIVANCWNTDLKNVGVTPCMRTAHSDPGGPVTLATTQL